MAHIELLRRLYRLKDVAREGWRLRGIGDVGEIESVAAHAWGTALLCLLFAEDAQVNRDEAVAMAIVHDLAEVTIGDIASLRETSERTHTPEAKAELEAQAMHELVTLAPSTSMQNLHAIWQAYEANESNTARFVRDMNLVDMAMQACMYEQAARTGAGALEEFFLSARERITTPLAIALLEEIMAARTDPSSSAS